MLKASGRRMNNIKRANVVILKQPTVEKAKSDYKNYTYSVTVAI